MLECLNVGCFNKEAKRLIACDIAKKVVCDKCHPEHSNSSKGLGVITKDLDGMTSGKKWEIENRTISKDGKIINRLTGQTAQR